MSKTLQLCLLVGFLLTVSCYTVFHDYIPPQAQPTCQERGGKTVTNGIYFIPSGKVLVPITRYRCDIP